MRCPEHSDRIASEACTICGDRRCPECCPRHEALQGPVCDRCRPTLPDLPPAPPTSSRPGGLWSAVLVATLTGLVGFFVLRGRPAPEPPDPALTMAATVDVLRETTRLLDARRAADGAWPLALDALVPSAAPDLPADPFAPSRSLRYGPAPGRAGAMTLWSVGPDGIDHGGRELDPVTGRGDVAVPLE